MNRDPVDGRYAFDNDFNRLCKCGHSLGAHIAGGHECGTNPVDYPETRGCDCMKFRPEKLTPNQQLLKAAQSIVNICGGLDGCQTHFGKPHGTNLFNAVERCKEKKKK